MTAKPLILGVDHNRGNLELLKEFLGKAGYPLRMVTNLEGFDQALAQLNEIGLALVDISGFDCRNWDCCMRLQDEEIPFLVLSSHQSAAIQQLSLAHGARSALVKPLVVKELLGLIQSLLDEQV